MRGTRVLFCLILGWFAVGTAHGEEGFPGRAEFPEVSVYELDRLAESFDRVTIVDVRSRYEYETLRVKGALNIPVASKKFEEGILALRQKVDGPIVCYCNGRSCFKSYHAVEKATAVGVQNIHAYDAGVFDWVRAHPEHSELLGKGPVNLDDLIAGDTFKSHLLKPEEFSAQALQGDAVLLDVRDGFQRAGVGLFVGKEAWASLDDSQRLKELIVQARSDGRALYIYDAVGKQVRWLQYLIEDSDVPEYYFMERGAKGFYEDVLGVTHRAM